MTTIPSTFATLTFIPKQNIEDFKRAAVQKNSDETTKVLKKLLKTDESIDFNPDPLNESTEHYGHFKGLLKEAYTAPSDLRFTPPLHYAAATGSLSALQKITNPLLLNSVDQKGLTPLHYAIMFKQKDVVLYLASKCNLNYLTNPCRDSYLHFAALQGDRQLLEFFINSKLDANLQNAFGLTPAHFWASASDDLTGLKRLKSADASLDTKTSDLLPLTPIEIQILRTLEANPDPVSNADLYLLGVNLARAACAGVLMNLAPSSYWKNRFSFWVPFVTREILGLGKHFLGEKLAPSNVSMLKSVIGPAQAVTAKFMSYSLGSTKIEQFPVARLPVCITAGATTAATAARFYTVLSSGKYADWGTKILAIGIHTINLAISTFDCYLEYQNPFNEYKTMDELARSSLQLTCYNEPPGSEKYKTCVQEARKILDPNKDWKKELKIISEIKEDNARSTALFELHNRIIRNFARAMDIEHHPGLDKQFLTIRNAVALSFGSALPNNLDKATIELLKKLSDLDRLNYQALQCDEPWHYSGSKLQTTGVNAELCTAKHELRLSPTGFGTPPQEYTGSAKDWIIKQAKEHYNSILDKLAKLTKEEGENLYGTQKTNWHTYLKFTEKHAEESFNYFKSLYKS